MIKLFNSVLIIILWTNVYGQKIQILSQGYHTDSSFYSVQKINENEYWVAGENGILKKIDSLGNMSRLNLPVEKIDILKIIMTNNYVFLTTANSIIYRYDIDRGVFIKKTFPEFKNKCFYDIIESEDGKLIVCGGARGIARGDKVIPKGFIATVDKDLTEIEVVWKCYRKFVWSLLECENKNILGVTFNGLNTRLIKSDNLMKWKNDRKIKGLVYNTALIDKRIWYCGAKSIHVNQYGTMGITTEKQKVSNNTGCLWSMERVHETIIAATQSGELIKIDKESGEFEKIKTPDFFTLYDMEKMSDSRMLVVGHGKTVYIIDFKGYF